VTRYPRWTTYSVLQIFRKPVDGLFFMPAANRAPEMFLLSDFTCTALQLANFWQGHQFRLRGGRIYLPLDDMRTMA